MNTETMTAEALELGQTGEASVVLLGQAAALPVVRETAKAALLELTAPHGGTREQWFPKAVLRFAPDSNPAFGVNLFALRSFVARNDLWHWTAE